MENIIEVTGLHFLNIITYPPIVIKPLQTTFICGESGCGKSTLLKLINGVITADAGQITYRGKNIMDYNSLALRREILLCHQQVYLFNTSIEENFHTYHDYRDLPHLSPAEITAYLSTCCFPAPLDTGCASLSGGERGRVFVAICLSLSPKVLMLDEPTAALDDKTAHWLMGNLIAFSKEKGMTLVVVSHSKPLAQQYGDQVITLEMRKKP